MTVTLFTSHYVRSIRSRRTLHIAQRNGIKRKERKNGDIDTCISRDYNLIFASGRSRKNGKKIRSSSRVGRRRVIYCLTKLGLSKNENNFIIGIRSNRISFSLTRMCGRMRRTPQNNCRIYFLCNTQYHVIFSVYNFRIMQERFNTKNSNCG